MAVREFTGKDRQKYLEMCGDFYESSAVDHSVDPANFEATFDAIMQGSPYVAGYMLEWEGRAAGYAQLSFTFSNEVGGLVVLVEEVYILPAYRGKGLGGELLAFIERTHAEARRFRLEVTPHNEGAQRLYERHGYSLMSYSQMAKDVL